MSHKLQEVLKTYYSTLICSQFNFRPLLFIPSFIIFILSLICFHIFCDVHYLFCALVPISLEVFQRQQKLQKLTYSENMQTGSKNKDPLAE